MAANLLQRIENIEAKATLMVERYEKMRKAKEAAEERIAELEAVIDRNDRMIDELNRRMEYLKAASVMTPGRDEVESTRALLAGLVREIDRCINKISI